MQIGCQLVQLIKSFYQDLYPFSDSLIAIIRRPVLPLFFERSNRLRQVRRALFDVNFEGIEGRNAYKVAYLLNMNSGIEQVLDAGMSKDVGGDFHTDMFAKLAEPTLHHIRCDPIAFVADE